MRLKRAFLFMAMIIGLATLDSCSSSSSPEDVVSKAFDAMIDGNYREMVKYICDSDGRLFTQEEQRELAQSIAMILKNEPADEKIVSYKITSVEFTNHEETSAEVWLQCTYADGHTETDLENLIKLPDGKWYICSASDSNDLDEFFDEAFDEIYDDDDVYDEAYEDVLDVIFAE